MSSSLRVIVSGLVGLYPVGGVAWDYLQYVLGLHSLGHDAYYHEDTWSWPFDPVSNRHTSTDAYSKAFIKSFFDRYAPELTDKWHYRHLHSESFGMEEARFNEVAASADIFLNVSGCSAIPGRLGPACLKVFVDTDPGYNQIVLSERPEWSENVDRWAASVDAHDRHLTYAENIHGVDCLVPRLHYNWTPTRMPVVLDLWKLAPPPANAPWTTVMTWNPFRGQLSYGDREYAAKGPEFDRIMSLPARVGVPLLVASGGRGVPLDQLSAAGWSAADGPAATRSPGDYQDFIQRSRGELSPAKQVYVALRTGWFSCRTACYLAAGRPAVVQDTGFSKVYRCGDGVVPFQSVEEAAIAIERVEADYQRHSEASRAFAETEFGATRVLGNLLESVYAPVAEAGAGAST